MPLYEYECPECGTRSDEFMRMCSAAEADLIACVPCQKNGRVMLLVRQVSLPHTDLKGFHTPIEMQSIGCNSMEEIHEMQRAGIQCSDDEADPTFGVPIAHNRHEKLKALRVAGFQEK